MKTERQRLGVAGYMELREKAGGFSCGRCQWASQGAAGLGFCLNPDVLATVSPTHGCCNLFKPKPGVEKSWSALS